MDDIYPNHTMDIEERIQLLKSKHPDWSEEQIKSAIAIELSAGNVVDKAGKDISPNDPDIMKAVLLGAKEWLHEVLPEIFAKVATFFDNLINTVGTWVEKGLTYVVEAIDYLWSKGKVAVEALKRPLDNK